MHHFSDVINLLQKWKDQNIANTTELFLRNPHKFNGVLITKRGPVELLTNNALLFAQLA